MSEYVRKRCVEGDAKTRKLAGTTRITKIVQPRRADNSRPGSLAQVRHALNALAASLTAKASGKPQPPTRIETIQPAVSPVGAIALRGALGLKTTAEQAIKSAQEMTAHVRRAASAAKAEGSQTGHPGRPIDPLPEAVKPAPAQAETPSVTQPQLPNSNGMDPFITDLDHAKVFTAIHAAWVRAGRRSISFDPAEIARATGLSVDQVRASVEALLASGQLQKDQNRPGAAFARLSPVI